MIGIGCIISLWTITPSDECLNMMPLFHIGGTVRNLFNPILSGGSVISCNGFNPIYSILQQLMLMSLIPILRTFHQVLGIALCIMFTINNNDIASNMLIVIVFYAISLSLMVNIKIYTYKSYLNDGP